MSVHLSRKIFIFFREKKLFIALLKKRKHQTSLGFRSMSVVARLDQFGILLIWCF